MKKLLKKSAVLDLVYSCCFILVFLSLLLLAQTNHGNFMITLIGQKPDAWRQLFLIFLIPGYIGLVYGVIGLVFAIKKLKHLDELETKLKTLDESGAKKFVKGYNMPVILFLLYFVFTLGLTFNGKGMIDVAVCIVALLTAFVIGFVTRSTKRKYLNAEPKAEVATESQPEPVAEEVVEPAATPVEETASTAEEKPE